MEHLATSNEVKGEVVSVHSVLTHAPMEVQLLNLTLNGGEGQLHALAAIPKGKELLFSTEQVLGKYQSQPRCFGEVKNLMSLLGIKPKILSCPTNSLITMTTLS